MEVNKLTSDRLNVTLILNSWHHINKDQRYWKEFDLEPKKRATCVILSEPQSGNVAEYVDRAIAS